MTHRHRLFHIGSLLLGLTAGFLGGFFLSTGTNSAEAQNNRSSGSSTSVTYSAKYINKVLPKKDDESLREVYSFPGAPVFLFRTDSGITIWERRGESIRSLKEITLNDDFEELIFLDDDETFIIWSDEGASIYTINRKISRDSR